MSSREPRSKACPSCVERRGLLPVSAFGDNCNNADGKSTYCKECARAIQRDWKAANADKVRKWRRAYVERVKARNQAVQRDAERRR